MGSALDTIQSACVLDAKRVDRNVANKQLAVWFPKSFLPVLFYRTFFFGRGALFVPEGAAAFCLIRNDWSLMIIVVSFARLPHA